MDYIAWHTGGMNATSTAPKGSIEITDHGEKIRWIGYFDAGKVRELAKNCKKRGVGFGLYRYVGMADNSSPPSLSVDASVPSWKAMGDVYSSSTILSKITAFFRR
jgi:hypothetical protein